MSRLVRYDEGKWFTAEKDGSFHLYNAFKNGKTGDPRQQPEKRKRNFISVIFPGHGENHNWTR